MKEPCDDQTRDFILTVIEIPGKIVISVSSQESPTRRKRVGSLWHSVETGIFDGTEAIAHSAQSFLLKAKVQFSALQPSVPGVTILDSTLSTSAYESVCKYPTGFGWWAFVSLCLFLCAEDER